MQKSLAYLWSQLELEISLLTFEIFGGCQDIHISSFSPSFQDLDHMKTNGTADIRIQDAKKKQKLRISFSMVEFKHKI